MASKLTAARSSRQLAPAAVSTPSSEPRTVVSVWHTVRVAGEMLGKPTPR
ncbi:hypothetical protein [Actinophytocola sp. NPDC049390]